MKKNTLKEASAINGQAAWEEIFGPIKKALGHFGKTVSASAKLIGNDVATIVKLNLHWKLRGLGAQKEIMDNWKSNRSKHHQTIYENSTAALESLGGDKYTCMAMCPGMFWSAAAYRGTGKLISSETRSMIGEYGAGTLPVIGTLFGGPKARGSRPGFWDTLIDGNDDPGSAEGAKDMKKSLERYLVGLGVDEDFFGAPSSGGGSSIKNILYKINDIFLLSSHNRHGVVLVEGGEESSTIDVAEEVLTEMVRESYIGAFQKERSAYLEEHREVYESVVSSIEKVLELNIKLATVQDADEFIMILQDAVKNNKEFKDIDVNKLEKEFKNMIEKLATDEKVIETLRKELIKSGKLKIKESSDLIAEEEKDIFKEQLKLIALNNCKAGYIQPLKEGVVDLYDSVYFAVTDGLQEETMKTIKEEFQDDTIANKFIDQIQEFQKRLDNSISQL